MTIHRLVYHSHSLFHLSEEGALHSIRKVLATSNRNNSNQNITGCLIIDRKCIVQIIEGDPRRIFDLFKKIEVDHRHKDVNLLDFQSVPIRSFAGWIMAGSVRTHLDEEIYKDHGIDGPIIPQNVTPLALISLSRELLRHQHA